MNREKRIGYIESDIESVDSYVVEKINSKRGYKKSDDGFILY